MKRLGYGMMRLPTTGPKEHAAVDLEQVCRLVDAFMDRGFSYFDTAYFYHEGQSEHIVRQAVAERHSRDSFLLADKMPMMHLKGKTAEDQARIFDDQLQKCGVDYFDYYLLHCLDRNSYEAAKELDTFAFLMGKKAEGRLRHLGFSFHDRAEVLDRILTEHPEAEFVQLQLNYLDWEDGTVQSRLCYETAVRHGKKVIVMEPVRGGRLAKLPGGGGGPAAPGPPRLVQRLLGHPLRRRTGACDDGPQRYVRSGPGAGQHGRHGGPRPPYRGGDRPAGPVRGDRCLHPRHPLHRLPLLRGDLPAGHSHPRLLCPVQPDAAGPPQGAGAGPGGLGATGGAGGKLQDCVGCGQCAGVCPQHIQVKDWVARMADLF